MTPKTQPRVHPFAANGRKIKRARRRIDISQERLAAQVGTTRRHMIRLENGEHLPGTGLRDRIAAAIGVEAHTIQASDDEDEESSPVLSLDEYLERRVRKMIRDQSGAA